MFLSAADRNEEQSDESDVYAQLLIDIEQEQSEQQHISSHDGSVRFHCYGREYLK